MSKYLTVVREHGLLGVIHNKKENPHVEHGPYEYKIRCQVN